MDEQRPNRRPRRLRAMTLERERGLDPIDALAASPYAPQRAGQPEPAEPATRARELPVLPVRNTVILPHMVVPLFVDREPALRAIEAAMEGDQRILIVAQRSEQMENPTARDVYQVGAECVVTRVLRLPDGSSSAIVQGARRVRIESWLQHAPYGRVRGVAYDEPEARGEQIEALARRALRSFETCVKLSQRLTEEVYIQALNIETPGALADYMVAQLEPPLPTRQEILETFDPALRLRHVCRLLQRELNVLEIERQIQTEVQQEAERGQRELFLREQLRAIQRELGESDPAQRECDELRTRLDERNLPAEARARAIKELDRLASMPTASPEYSVLRTYLDWLLGLPWGERTPDVFDLQRVAETLDQQHYGLERVKDRILEFMAVRKLAPQGRAPILCFVGAPGVGKTSLGRSIAEAVGRKFARISLGGVRDEAEIRGHRRTYVGALPGRIIQAMKTVGVSNPVLVLDEVDKLASEFRGDPAAALLELLDPEQNSAFSDHYLELPYDLSQALFILTANSLSAIPAPLRDRLEVIEVPSYTADEKLHIARDFLVPRQMRETGLSAQRIEFDDAALLRLIHEYTYEAGVRGLEREIGAIMRKVARRVVEGRRHKAIISAQRVPAYLGPQKYFPTEREERDEVGVATGLAWTSGGGDLTTVEVMTTPGRGELTLTGQLGEVMKESAQAALTFTRARAVALGLPELFHERNDVHIHLPAASVPKDGPSAGVTMAVALVSALTGRAVRRDVAMTGEITLRGRVLPVGGVKEKALAAHRAGLTTMALPRRNAKDLEELPEYVRSQLTFVLVESVDDALAVALLPATHAEGERRLMTRDDEATDVSLRAPHPHISRAGATPRLTRTERVARPRTRRSEVSVAGAQ